MLGRRWLRLQRAGEVWALRQIELPAPSRSVLVLRVPTAAPEAEALAATSAPPVSPVTHVSRTSQTAPRGRSSLVAVLAAAVLIPLGGLGGALVAVAQDAARYEDLIYPGVFVAGADVGGLTRRQAAERVQAMAATRLNRAIALYVPSDHVVFRYEELGLRAHPDEAVEQAYAVARTGPPWERLPSRFRLSREQMVIPLRFSQDKGAVLAALEPLAGDLNAVPQNAEVTVRARHVVIVRHSRDGRSMDVQTTLERITAAMQTDGTEVTAVVKIVEPEFTSDQARELQAPLASYTTVMALNPNRIHNIALAAEFVRGIILPPGAVFSYNEAVGPRTTERGFKEAPVLIDDELVPGDGGGICQVSSTLFNVVLLADMEIVSRVNHTRPVPYLPLGRDATAVYGAVDFKFRNSTGHHVLLWADIVGRRLTVTAYGTPAPGKEVTVQVTEREEIPPPKHTVTKNDPELEAGTVVTREAQPGYRVRTYRVVRVDGKAGRNDLIGLSYYRPVPRTIKIGTKKGQEEHAGR